MDISKIYEDFSNLTIVINNAVPDCFKNNIGLTAHIAKFNRIIKNFHNSLNRTHVQLDEVRRKMRKTQRRTNCTDRLFRVFKFQSNCLILKGNSSLFSEYYSTFRKALGDYSMNFL